MNSVLQNIGTLCIFVALFLDTASYWKQIAKCWRTKKSTQVSSSQYLYKIAKAVIAIIGLGIYKNWVGMTMDIWMFIVYTVSLLVVAHYKPKSWKLFGKSRKK